MSKYITINEGGTSASFTASRLITRLAEGGTCGWIPEDEADVSAAVLEGAWRIKNAQITLPAPSFECGIYAMDSHSVSYFKIADCDNKRIYCANMHETSNARNLNAYYGMVASPDNGGEVLYTNGSGNKMNDSIDLQIFRMSVITFTSNISSCRCNTAFLDWFGKYFRREEI